MLHVSSSRRWFAHGAGLRALDSCCTFTSPVLCRHLPPVRGCLVDRMRYRITLGLACRPSPVDRIRCQLVALCAVALSEHKLGHCGCAGRALRIQLAVTSLGSCTSVHAARIRARVGSLLTTCSAGALARRSVNCWKLNNSGVPISLQTNWLMRSFTCCYGVVISKISN